MFQIINTFIIILYILNPLSSPVLKGSLQNETILGNSYSALGMYKDAEKTFKKILDFDEDNKVAKINLAKVCFNSKLLVRAYYLYEDLIEWDTTNSYFQHEKVYLKKIEIPAI